MARLGQARKLKNVQLSVWVWLRSLVWNDKSGTWCGELLQGLMRFIFCSPFLLTTVVKCVYLSQNRLLFSAEQSDKSSLICPINRLYHYHSTPPFIQKVFFCSFFTILFKLHKLLCVCEILRRSVVSKILNPVLLMPTSIPQSSSQWSHFPPFWRLMLSKALDLYVHFFALCCCHVIGWFDRYTTMRYIWHCRNSRIFRNTLYKHFQNI